MPHRTPDDASSGRWTALSARWARRALTVPGYLLAFLLAVIALPPAAAAALLLDAGDWRRAPRTRFVVGVVFLLACEAAGIAGSLLTWALSGGPSGAGSPRAHRYDRSLQRLWAGALFGGGRRLLGLRLRVGGDPLDDVHRPILVLARHASLVDSLLPIVLLPDRRLRYVLKHELLWDPCLDIVGSRLPNAFVVRGAGDPAEVERVAALARALGPDEGVVLFPEGTRFTPERRQKLLDRLDAGADEPRQREAESLRYTLPPRRGGVVALLEAAPAADVVVLVHTGLESAARLGDLWRGSLRGGTLEVELWHVDRSTIPGDRDGREAWLSETWRRVDAWVASRRAAAESTSAAATARDDDPGRERRPAPRARVDREAESP